MEIKIDTKKSASAIGINAHSGKNGSSAYEVAVENGFSGTEAEWLSSLKGEKGEKGDRGREIKASVVIGNSAKGATADTCDFLYNEGDDFAVCFAEAGALAKKIGARRVELLSGEYRTKSTLIMDFDELVGVGRPTIIAYDDTLQDEILHLDSTNTHLENISVGMSADGASVAESGAEKISIYRSHFSGDVKITKAFATITDSDFDNVLRFTSADGSYITRCRIENLTILSLTENALISECVIGSVNAKMDENIFRNNTIGGVLQTPSILEQIMRVKFGRITSPDATEALVRTIETGAFEIYINEESNMTVSLYTGGSDEPAQTLSSDVFIFISGGFGDDVYDGADYQKTLILYMKKTLGIASLSKWIAVSGSRLYPDARIEITCPENTYRGVIKNEAERVYCEE